jgi:biopolymer transport protein ExbD
MRDRSVPLFTAPSTSHVLCVAFVPLLVIFLVMPTPSHHGLNVDLPKVHHPTPLPGAMREDALVVSIARDSSVFFDSEKLTLESLREKLAQEPSQRVRPKVYIKADARSKYGVTKQVIASIRAAGIYQIAFLAEARRSF